MPTIRESSALTGVTVAQAMRRQVVRCAPDRTLADGIRALFKYKTNALLVSESAQEPRGVISKTDLMGAYYAALPLTGPLTDIMAAPPVYGFPDDGLEACLDTMQHHGIHQLYILGSARDQIIGVVDYSDILGLLYRYCRRCTHGRRPKDDNATTPPGERLRVQDVMTPEVETRGQQTPIAEVIEVLAARGFGAILILDQTHQPTGVISKSDLMMAYRQRVPLDAPAETIMGRPAYTCAADTLLADAIQLMLVRDIQRLFIHHPQTAAIVGVLSLSNAARFRSGTCHACRSSRLLDP